LANTGMQDDRESEDGRTTKTEKVIAWVEKREGAVKQRQPMFEIPGGGMVGRIPKQDRAVTRRRSRVEESPFLRG